MPPADAADPLLVEVTRGPMAESLHRGAAVLADAGGRIHARWGEEGRLVYPRSAVKPIQAIPLVESGAADAFALTGEELALACASHNGEPAHVAAAAGLLARLGLGEHDLECGAHAPMHGPSADALIREGRAPSALHNNCSGKHGGFLATALHEGWPTAGYIGRSHPVQQRILGVLEQVTAQDLGSAPWGLDGCSIPTIAVSLGGLAVGMARMADPAGLPDRRAEAVLRIRKAWTTHPFFIAGSGRFDTAVIEATGGRVLVKVGAEGVYCACLPEEGLGLALKIDDGAGRAAEVALAAVLMRLGLGAGLEAFTTAPVATRRGAPAGIIRAAGPPA
jgi:L-asparaginase II